MFASAMALAAEFPGHSQTQPPPAVVRAKWMLDVEAGRLVDAGCDSRGTPDRPAGGGRGPLVGISGGTCDFSGIGVRGAEAFRARVRQDVERGVDLIKVCVSGWLADAIRDPNRFEIADEELVAAIDETHSLGKRVAVHALSAGGIRLAVERGADLVAHGGFTTPETLDVMKRRGVYLLPTLFSYPGVPPARAFATIQQQLHGAVRAGLPIAFGTDAGVIPHGSNAREFGALTAIGMNPADALRAATIWAAKAVGMSGHIGTFGKGTFADVIAVSGNPLEDVSALQRVRFVMKSGRISHGRGVDPGR